MPIPSFLQKRKRLSQTSPPRRLPPSTPWSATESPNSVVFNVESIRAIPSTPSSSTISAFFQPEPLLRLPSTPRTSLEDSVIPSPSPISGFFDTDSSVFLTGPAPDAAFMAVADGEDDDDVGGNLLDPDRDSLSLDDNDGSEDAMSEDGRVEEDRDDYDKAAEELLRFLLEDGLGCAEANHVEELDRHVSAYESDHHDLSVTYTYSGPSSRSNLPAVGLHSTDFPSNKGLPRHKYLSAAELEALFEGSQAQDQPAQVCLHQEEASDAEPLQSFDFDAVLLFTRTLAAFRRGFRYCPVKNVKRVLRQDLHVQRPVYWVDDQGRTRRQQRPLRNIPHLYLGTVDGFYDAQVFVFFPWLGGSDRKFTYLTDEQVKRFTDRVMFPACQQHLTADQIQHFPPTHEVAELNARAKGVEHESYTGERGRKQFPHFYIPAAHLPVISTTLRHFIEDSRHGLADFRDLFFFVDVKGIKLDFKVLGSLSRTMAEFQSRIHEIFQLDLVDELISDVAKEVCAPSPGSSDGDHEALVYLWKTCCLQHQYQSLVDGAFEGKRGQMRLYHVGFLRDAASMTLVPPARSWIRKAGWLYGQWYNSAKEIGNAQACYPFDNPKLTQLAIDEGVWLANASSAKLSARQDRGRLVRSYIGSKGRVWASYHKAAETSFGHRMEFRISWKLFLALQRRTEIWEASRASASRLPSHPSSVWALSTRSYVDFMIGNYDKITTALEITSLTSATSGIPLERTKLMIVLIKCLQRFANSQLGRESALWYDHRPFNGDEVKKGLGFESTMPTFGFGWFMAGRVDWEALQFDVAITAHMPVSDRTLLSWYHCAGRLIQDTTHAIDCCLRCLSRADHSSTNHEPILRLLAHFCFRQYRRDILLALEKELRRTVTTDHDKDAIQFCYDGVTEAFINPPNLVSGNRVQVKTTSLIDWIWGSSTAFNRKFFVNRPFRIMKEKIEKALNQLPGLTAQWDVLFPQEFLDYHWLIPYPHPNGTLIAVQKEKSKGRQWWSNDRHGKTHAWRWARGKYRSGYPPPYPRGLDMMAEELVHYLAQL